MHTVLLMVIGLIKAPFMQAKICCFVPLRAYLRLLRPIRNKCCTKPLLAFCKRIIFNNNIKISSS